MADDIDITSILTYFYPGASWEWDGKSYDGLRWTDKTIPKPSLDELRGKNDQAKKMAEAISSRRRNYPSIEDQLDALWKGGTVMEEMRQTVLAVKTAYPKP